MTLWTADGVASALGLATISGPSFSDVATDTRTLREGSLFVALSGERYDGHAFLSAAWDAGARGAVVRRGTPRVHGLSMYEVDDTLHAYGLLARYRRRSLTGPVIAITGTNGKTSTKEMIVALMRAKWKTHGTRSNNNNRVGVPLTILEAPSDTEAIVVEAGANELGEIASLREVIEPTVAVITNVAAAHLEGFGSVARVLQEKVSLLDGVPVAVVGEDPAELPLEARRSCPRVVVAGLSRDADIRPDRWELDTTGFGVFTYAGDSIRLAIPGEHQVVNAMMALGVAREIGLKGDFARILAGVTVPGGRCEVVQNGSLTIVNDTYNANPASLLAALRLAERLRRDRRVVVVVGSMLELGDESKNLHRDAAAAIMRIQPDVIAATGCFVEQFERKSGELNDRLVTAATVEDLGRALRGHLEGGELVVLKASRGVGLEHIIPYLTAN